MAIRTSAYETNQLAKHLREVVNNNDHDIITWNKLSEIAGCDVKTKGAGYVRTARRRVEGETGKLFVTVIGKGVRLATIDDQVAEPSSQIKRARRLANRSMWRLANCEYDKLPGDAKKSHNAAASVFGAIKLFTRRQSLEKISAKVDNSKLDVDDTLKLFSS